MICLKIASKPTKTCQLPVKVKIISGIEYMQTYTTAMNLYNVIMDVTAACRPRGYKNCFVFKIAKAKNSNSGYIDAVYFQPS